MDVSNLGTRVSQWSIRMNVRRRDSNVCVGDDLHGIGPPRMYGSPRLHRLVDCLSVCLPKQSTDVENFVSLQWQKQTKSLQWPKQTKCCFVGLLGCLCGNEIRCDDRVARRGGIKTNRKKNVPKEQSGVLWKELAAIRLTCDDDRPPLERDKIRNCGQMVRSNMNFVGSLPFRGG